MLTKMSEGKQQRTYFGEGKYVPFHEWGGAEDRRVKLKDEFLIRTRRRAPGHYPYPDLEQSECKATVTAQQQRLLFPRYEGPSRHQVLRDSRVAACATTHVTETTNYFNIDGPLVWKRLIDEMGRIPNRALIGSVSEFWSEQVVSKVRELAGEEGGIVWEIAKDLSNRDADYRERLRINIEGMAVGIPEAILMARGCLVRDGNGEVVEAGRDANLAAQALGKPWVALSYNHERYGKGPKLETERYHKVAKDVWKVCDCAIWIDYLSSQYNVSEGIEWYDRGLAPYTMGVVVRLSNNPEGDRHSVATSRLWLSLEGIAGSLGRGLYSYSEVEGKLRLVDCGAGKAAEEGLEKLANIILTDQLIARKVSFQEDYGGFARWAINLLCVNSGVRSRESGEGTAERLGAAAGRLFEERGRGEKWEIERFLDDVGREPGKDRVAWAGFLEVYTMTRFSVAPAVDTRRLQYKVFACGRCAARVGLLCCGDAALVAAGLSDGSTARDGRVLVVTPLTPWQQRRLCVGDRLAGMQLSANAVSVCQGMALVDSARYEQNRWAEDGLSTTV